MTAPRSSIIMPTYNRAYIISTAIDSVRNQTDQDWELIVIDDGSTDTTKQVVEATNDERIRYVFRPNAGASAARNHGLSLAKGEWIAYLDSDNELLPEFLETMHAALRHRPEAVFALARTHRILELYENGKLAKTIIDTNDIKTDTISIHDIFMRTFHVDTNGLMHHRKVYEAGVQWDPTIPVMEDWEFALSIGNQYPNGFVFVNKVLFTYYQRFGGDGLRSNSAYEDTAIAFEMIYRKHKNDPLMEGQSWYPAGRERWHQRQVDFENGKLPPYSHFYFIDT